MKEGVNQGCQLPSTLAAIVLHEVLAPLETTIKLHTATQQLNSCPYDDDAGGEIHPMAFVDKLAPMFPTRTSFSFYRCSNVLQLPLGSTSIPTRPTS
jgi:hypothetical protein